jgi:folate-binding protein YgfZ
MDEPWRSPLLDRPGAVAAAGPDAGVAWHYGDPVAEQRALEAGAAVVDLSHLGVVTVAGPDRLAWLTSITSQQLADLPPGTSTETLVLSPNGHVEHAAAVVDDGERTWLVTEGASASALAVWLDSMRFMMRVEVSDVTAAWAALGDVGGREPEGGSTWWRDPWPAVLPGGTRYGPAPEDHPGAGWSFGIVLVPRGEVSDVVARRAAAGARPAGMWAAEALRVAAARPRRATEVDHRTIPHELDWLRTAVHLDKGCYRGQETVARVHNLGRPPRRLVLLHLDGSGHLLPRPGAVVVADGRKVGAVTSVARHHVLGPIALAVVRRGLAVDAPVTVACDGGDVAGAQEEVVGTSGESVDRPAKRGPVARGIGAPFGTRGATGRLGT